MASLSHPDQHSLAKLMQEFASEPALGNGVPSEDRDYYAQELVDAYSATPRFDRPPKAPSPI